jgi:hypothetical protein
MTVALLLVLFHRVDRGPKQTSVPAWRGKIRTRRLRDYDHRRCEGAGWDLSQLCTEGLFRYAVLLIVRWRSGGMINFKGSHFEREIILWGMRWYVA